LVGSESTFLVPCSNPLQERRILSDLTDWHEGAPWRGSGSGPLRGNSNRYVPPYNHHCIRREPVALSAGRGCDSNFTLSLALALYCRLHIGFERYILPGPTQSQTTRWLIADRSCAHLLRRNEPFPRVCRCTTSSLVFSGPPKTINRATLTAGEPAYIPSSRGRCASTPGPSYPSWTRSTRSRACLRSPARAPLHHRSLLQRIRPLARSVTALQAAPCAECVAVCNDQRRFSHLRCTFEQNGAAHAAANRW
jgi:hypothetical protein